MYANNVSCVAICCAWHVCLKTLSTQAYRVRYFFLILAMDLDSIYLWPSFTLHLTVRFSQDCINNTIKFPISWGVGMLVPNMSFVHPLLGYVSYSPFFRIFPQPGPGCPMWPRAAPPRSGGIRDIGAPFIVVPAQWGHWILPDRGAGWAGQWLGWEWAGPGEGCRQMLKNRQSRGHLLDPTQPQGQGSVQELSPPH